MVAWALATLGSDTGSANQPESEPGEESLRDDPIHAWLLDAFAYRIEHATDPPHHGGLWPPEMITRGRDLGRMDRYKLAKLRASWVLEPLAFIDPYERFTLSNSPDGEALINASEERRSARQREQFERMWTRNRDDEYRLRLLTVALGTPTLAPSYRAELLKRANKLVGDLKAYGSGDVSQMLRAALKTSRAYASEDVANTLTMWSMVWSSQDRDRGVSLFEAVDGARYALHQPGVRRALGALLEVVASRSSPGPASERVAKLHHFTDLEAAAGRLVLGQSDGVVDTFAAVEATLSTNRWSPVFHERLARAYLAALRTVPMTEAIGKIEHLLEALPPLGRSPLGQSMQSSGTHFSLEILYIVEGIVIAVCDRPQVP